MGGTTTLDIGNDLNIKGGVINTNRAQGAIGGNVNIESLQDTATYDSDQKNMGFSADIDIAGGGAGSSLSVNGGKTNVNADSKIVNEQSGIFSNEADLTANSKGSFTGAVFTTSKEAQANGKSNIVFKQGISSQDIKNTTSYEGEALSIGLSIGNTTGKPQATMNGIGYGTDSDSDSSITRAGITGVAGNSSITTDTRAEYAGALENVFDASQVNEELGAQVEITQAFDQERRKVKTEINKKEQKLRDEAEEARDVGEYEIAVEKARAAEKLQTQGLLFDAVSGALYGPNSSGVTGYVAKSASPFVASQIGDYFKNQAFEQGGELTNIEQAGHILAHGILGAAISYATGNDAITGGISAGAGEATAPLLSKFLYETTDPSKLTAEQKDTISAITSALGAGIGLTTGNASDAVNAAETSKVAVEDNYLTTKLGKGSFKKDITYQSFNDAIAKCKKSQSGCASEIQKYLSEHQANFKALKEKCGNGGLSCPTREGMILSSLNTAKKLEDPDARKIAVLMLTQDLLLLENGIDVWDRTYSMVADPVALATMIGSKRPSGATLSLAQTKAVLKEAGITSIAGMSIDAGLQKLLNGEISYRDVIATGLSGAVLGGIGSNAKAPSATSGTSIRQEDINSLIAEHSKSNPSPLTDAGANSIMRETLPKGTSYRVAGDDIAGPDVFVNNIKTGKSVTTIQIKSVSGNPRAFESQVKLDLNKSISDSGGSKIIAVQVPSNSKAADPQNLRGKLGNFSKAKVAGRSIIVVDNNGKVIIPLTPMDKFSRK